MWYTRKYGSDKAAGLPRLSPAWEAVGGGCDGTTWWYLLNSTGPWIGAWVSLRMGGQIMFHEGALVNAWLMLMLSWIPRNWDFGEPNNQGLGEDCVMMLSHGRWNDAACAGKVEGWICEKEWSC